jgi:hypothetical protein
MFKFFKDMIIFALGPLNELGREILFFYLFVLFTFVFFVYIIACASFVDKSNNPNNGNY